MNWGNKILVVFIAFGSMISYMVYRCMRTPVNLVSEQYYKDELAYQNVIDGTRQANALSYKVGLVTVNGTIRVNLPPEMRNRAVKGTIIFYCPSDARRDRSIRLRADAAGQQDIEHGIVPAGHYTVKLSWESEGVRYFNEQSFINQ